MRIFVQYSSMEQRDLRVDMELNDAIKHPGQGWREDAIKFFDSVSICSYSFSSHFYSHVTTLTYHCLDIFSLPSISDLNTETPDPGQ